MEAAHDRLPAVLWPGRWPWGDAHRAVLKPCPDEWLRADPVANDHGAVNTNDPEEGRVFSPAYTNGQ